MVERLVGKRVVVTEAAEFLGPAIIDLFQDEAAEIIADTRDLTQAQTADDLIREAGRIDVLIANLAIANPRALAHQTTDEEWARVFDRLVHPLHRLTRAVLPQMIERRAGKIVVIGSAAALRGTANRSCYAAARGAQHTYVKCVGVEVAPHNVQVNAIAPIFVENPTYFPPARIVSDEVRERLKEVPAGRLATAREAAQFVLFLASGESDFLVGQVFAYAGGWVA